MDRREAERQIVALVSKAQDIALQVGIPNILQPGLMKELIIADVFGHEVICSKRDADACDPQDHTAKYEYLSCYEGGTGQLDRMFKSPPTKRAESLRRITRNKSIYLAVFFKTRPLTVKAIYEIAPNVLQAEAERQLDRSRNEISHVGFSESWAAKNGKSVYECR
jgi:hypothetical protein